MFRAADFPLAAALPSTDSTGVTRVFAGFSGTTTASDPSELVSADCGLAPSRRCLPRTGGEALPRSPDSRSKGICEPAELQDPGWSRRSTSASRSARMVRSRSEGRGHHRSRVFRSSIARPVHAPSYASNDGSLRRSQGLGFPGADSSRGRTSSFRCCLLISVTYFLLPVFIGAYRFPSPLPVSASRLRSVSAPCGARGLSAEGAFHRPCKAPWAVRRAC